MPTDLRPRVAIVNDYEVIVHGVRAMLEPYRDHVRIVEVAASEPVEEPVDVALFDTFSTASPSAPELQTLLENPLVGAVAVYAWNVPTTYVHDAITVGVRGVLPKSLEPKELVRAIERIAAGEIVRPAAGITASGGANVGRDWPGRAEGLTEREADVIALISQGLSNDEITRRLYLSINTVKSYIRTAYRTMGVASRSQAVLWAVQHGFTQSSGHVAVK
ncbi:response regulator transcription factor [Calidifontibacter sp. DB0510]|uniref:Response regulator transcription factor n=1 Tax=Metallococcus carri TaxID=1656884 RepID=A0A967E813_9MICO|nr:response regulator transcription factor [Metallococcus carri]NHN54737.1 response regulator transcription factor [Metallococcus carri]NOP37082.1 response regulator transcription factor [Calidifontibacter sp. DB2511S]